MEAFCQFLGVPYDEWAFMVHRSELYAEYRHGGGAASRAAGKLSGEEIE